MRNATFVVMALVLVFSLSAACQQVEKATGVEAPGGGAYKSACACEVGKAGGTIWCEDCQTGYVQGENVTCAGCYAAKTTGTPCPSCSAR